MYRTVSRSVIALLCLLHVAIASAQEVAKQPIVLSPGPHLLIDDYLIAKSEAVRPR